MANPNPSHKIKPLYGDEPLAQRPLAVRVSAELDAYVRSLPNMTEWLRQTITAQVERELQEKKNQQPIHRDV